MIPKCNQASGDLKTREATPNDKYVVDMVNGIPPVIGVCPWVTNEVVQTRPYQPILVKAQAVVALVAFRSVLL